MSNKALQKISLLSPTGRKATNHSHTSSQYRSIHINPGCLSMYKQHQHKRTSLKKNNNNAGPCTSVAHVESSCNKDELSSDQTMKKWKGKDPRKKKKHPNCNNMQNYQLFSILKRNYKNADDAVAIWSQQNICLWVNF